ncbi:MAG: DUF2103 domain-containing protein [Chloroflexota bacterium]
MARKMKKGRLVLNHSTHITGLMPVLDRLIEVPKIKTITPGRLAQVKGRPTPLKIKVTVPIMGGYKMQARSSGRVQEVFVVTDLDAEALQRQVDAILMS